MEWKDIYRWNGSEKNYKLGFERAGGWWRDSRTSIGADDICDWVFEHSDAGVCMSLRESRSAKHGRNRYPKDIADEEQLMKVYA